MLIHISLLFLLSIIVIFLLPSCAGLVHILLDMHGWFNHLLSELLAHGRWINLIREALSLIIVPLIIAAIPTLIYWLIKRRFTVVFYYLVWAIWLILVVSLAVH